jgi:hypothetical protein
MAIDPRTADDAIEAVRKDIDALDDDTMNCVVGIAQALHELTKALEDVDARIDQRKYQAAADLGYRSVASSFIFLQRVLGEVNSLESRKALIVQDLARKLHCAYEDISPYVDAVMKSMQPRRPITLEDAAKHEAASERFARWSAKYAPDALLNGDEQDDDEQDDDELDDDELDDDEVDDDELDEVEAPSDLSFAQSMGFGSEGWRKAKALHRAAKTTPTEEQAIQLPQETWAQVARESERLAVTGNQLVQAAIASWLESNPKKAKSSG